MISNTTVAHLSACKYVLKDQALKIARERIRLEMGTLKALGECWPLAKEIYREVGVIAREILCLVDQDITPRIWDLSQEQPYCTSPAFTFDSNPTLNFINFEGLNPMSLYGGSL